MLSRRILVRESLPLPIRGPATKSFQFTKLLKSGVSKTLQNENLTVQMVSNPAWYAVLALPYLMEYPYECSEQIFNRLYANSLARTIANSDPKIHRIFEQWRNTPALQQPAGEKPGPQERGARGNPLAAPGRIGKPGAQKCGHSVRRQPAEFRNRAHACRSWPKCNIPMGPGRGSRAGMAMITSPSTSPPVSGACGTLGWMSASNPRSSHSAGWMAG